MIVGNYVSPSGLTYAEEIAAQGTTAMNGAAFVRTIHHLGFHGRSFAAYIGVKAETVSRWANGHRPVPKVVMRLLDALLLNAVKT